MSAETEIYIDGANLYSAAKVNKIEIDYRKFYIWLSENFKTNQIYLFLGYVKENEGLYSYLRSAGYKLIFKKTLKSKGKIKGNCDAELVLHATSNIIRKKFYGIVLVSSDGDFSCLLEFALKEGKKVTVISPSRKLSYLIRRLNIPITYLNDILELVKNEKTPGRN